jgi:hypothetical protein
LDFATGLGAERAAAFFAAGFGVAFTAGRRIGLAGAAFLATVRAFALAFAAGAAARFAVGLVTGLAFTTGVDLTALRGGAL